MPLIKSASKPALKQNMRTLYSEIGKSPHVKNQKQAEAIALETQRRTKGRAFGGVSPMLGQASNMMPPGSNPAMPPQMPINGVAGAMQPSPMMGPANGINAPMAAGMTPRPYAAGGGINPIKSTFTGPIVSKVPGRTDNHFGHVPSGSYVIPADIVSGRGQGNSLAGMDALHKLFRMGQNNSMSTRLPFGGNRLAKGNKFSKGGYDHDKHVGKPVQVRLAGGEIVLAPHHVQETMSRLSGKKLSLDEAHKEMDKWVISERKKLRKTLVKLPGPARD
jgi:hypothetical protein